MRNSIVLNDLFESSYCAIVFQVEYVINMPIQRNLISTVKNKVDKSFFYFKYYLHFSYR